GAMRGDRARFDARGSGRLRRRGAHRDAGGGARAGAPGDRRARPAGRHPGAAPRARAARRALARPRARPRARPHGAPAARPRPDRSVARERRPDAARKAPGEGLVLRGARMKTAVDVVVVSSGAGGGVVAGELAQRGREVPLVEAGPHLTAADFTRWEAKAT